MVFESSPHLKQDNNILLNDYIFKIQHLLINEKKNELLKYIKEIHNADLAEIIQNLDDRDREKFIYTIIKNTLLA